MTDAGDSLNRVEMLLSEFNAFEVDAEVRELYERNRKPANLERSIEDLNGRYDVRFIGIYDRHICYVVMAYWNITGIWEKGSWFEFIHSDFPWARK